MNEPRVSIIVPVYNAEKWLADCLESALGQTVADIEVIAVDDGSTDGSLEILRDFAARDPRLKVLVNEKNQGQAATRNRGIDVSTGRWLAFLDNDDLLAPDFCRVLLAEAEKSGADIIKGRTRITEPDGRVHETPRECQRDIMQKSPLCFNESWWTAIYRAEKIRGKVRLHDNASLGEDLIFLVETISLPLRVACIDDIVYLHMRRNNSGQERRNRSLKKIEASINSGISILQTLNERQVQTRDPAGYRVWAREALRWLGGFHRAREGEHEAALRLCAARSPQVASLIRCEYPGFKRYLMPLVLKILTDDRLLPVRRLLFRCYGFAKARKHGRAAGRSDRLKCLFIMHDWDGGAEKTSLNLAKSLDRQTIDPTVCCLHHLPELTAMMPEGQKFSLPDAPGLLPKIRHFWKMRQMAGKSDVVVGTLQLQSVLAAALLAPGKAIAWLRNDLAGKFEGRRGLAVRAYKALLGWALRRARTIVCVSEGVRRSSAGIWPDLAPRLTVLWNATDTEKIRMEAAKPLPEALEACFQKPVILGVGRLEKQKNFPLLIEACALLRERGRDFNLCLVGRGSLRESLEKSARDAGMEGHVFFAGYQSNPYALMARSAVLALSSNHEGNPNVLIEALCVGIPVVATDCPSGPDEILRGGEFGRLVPMNDAEALADALEAVLAAPPDAAKIAAGKKRAEDFSLENAAAAWQNLLRETAEQQRGKPA
ncbi:MAG: glycosyltransferase [Desulfovibrio sp.]|nr:glycosyltransferase [Desulfovibrio sp.]